MSGAAVAAAQNVDDTDALDNKAGKPLQHLVCGSTERQHPQAKGLMRDGKTPGVAVPIAETEDIDEDDDTESCRTVIDARVTPAIRCQTRSTDDGLRSATNVGIRSPTAPSSATTHLNGRSHSSPTTKRAVEGSRSVDQSAGSDNCNVSKNGATAAGVAESGGNGRPESGAEPPSAATMFANRKLWLQSTSIGDLSSVNSELSRRDSQLVDWNEFRNGARSLECDFDADEHVESDVVDDELFDSIFAPSAVELVRVVLRRTCVGPSAASSRTSTPPKSPGLHPALAARNHGDRCGLAGSAERRNNNDPTGFRARSQSESSAAAAARLMTDSSFDGGCDDSASSNGDQQFGFSLSDGLYERGVFVSAIRPRGPAAGPNGLKLYDKILQVKITRRSNGQRLPKQGMRVSDYWQCLLSLHNGTQLNPFLLTVPRSLLKDVRPVLRSGQEHSSQVSTFIETAAKHLTSGSSASDDDITGSERTTIKLLTNRSQRHYNK